MLGRFAPRWLGSRRDPHAQDRAEPLTSAELDSWDTDTFPAVPSQATADSEKLATPSEVATWTSATSDAPTTYLEPDAADDDDDDTPRAGAVRRRALVAATCLIVGSALVVSTAASGQSQQPTMLAAKEQAAAAAPRLAPELLADNVASLDFKAPPAPKKQSPVAAANLPSGPLGIPGIVLEAYKLAATRADDDNPGCKLPWFLLAGIGRIESNHATNGSVDASGTTINPIMGPILNGTLAGNEVITDTDGGKVDGDPTHDRAMGPMQFIPSTWAKWGRDANGDGKADPNNIFDATYSAGLYLCSGVTDIMTAANRVAAVLRYNNSMEYVANVLAWAAAYATGVMPTRSIPEPKRPSSSSSSKESKKKPRPGDPRSSSASSSASPSPSPSTSTTKRKPPPPCFIFCPPPPKPAR